MKHFHAIFFTDMSSKTWHMRPLGAYRLASELRDHGYNVLVVEYFSKWLTHLPDLYKLIKSCVSDKTLFVGYSSTFFSNVVEFDRSIKTHRDYYGSALSAWPISVDKIKILNKLIKKCNDNVKIFYGGTNASRINNDIKNSGIDYAVQGYADGFIVQILDKLSKNEYIKYNLSKSAEVKIIDYDIKGEQFNFPESVTRYHESDFIRTNESLPLETSRGCLFKCKFCSYPLLGRKKNDPDYHKHTHIMAQEFADNFEKYGVTKYTMLDDTFNESTDKLQSIYEAMQESGVKNIEFNCYLRLDLIDRYPEQIALLKKMGIRSAFMGIETLNQEAAKAIGKTSQPDRVKQTLIDIKSDWGDSANIFGSFIAGLPHDNEQTINEWMSWVYDRADLIDSYRILPLFFNGDPVFPSELEKNPKKFGYQMFASEKNQWINNVGLNFIDAINQSDKWMDRGWKSQRLKIAGAEMIGMQNLGYSFDQLKHYSLDRLPYEEFGRRYEQIFHQYKNNLIDYISC